MKKIAQVQPFFLLRIDIFVYKSINQIFILKKKFIHSFFKLKINIRFELGSTSRIEWYFLKLKFDIQNKASYVLIVFKY